jgi:phosphoglycolate phosphatase-like HAD superfamily hydrolase
VIADAPERLAQSGDQLGAACSGSATLLFLVTGNSAASWAKTLSGVLAIAGLSLAGLTGTLKNSAQALLKRLRQDAYTDLVAVAVQTAPRPPNRSALQQAINRRGLTPATPH